MHYRSFLRWRVTVRDNQRRYRYICSFLFIWHVKPATSFQWILSSSSSSLLLSTSLGHMSTTCWRWTRLCWQTTRTVIKQPEFVVHWTISVPPYRLLIRTSGLREEHSTFVVRKGMSYLSRIANRFNNYEHNSDSFTVVCHLSLFRMGLTREGPILCLWTNSD